MVGTCCLYICYITAPRMGPDTSWMLSNISSRLNNHFINKWNLSVWLTSVLFSIHFITSITFSDLMSVAYCPKSEDPRVLFPTNKRNRQQANLMLWKSEDGRGKDLKRKRGPNITMRSASTVRQAEYCNQRTWLPRSLPLILHAAPHSQHDTPPHKPPSGKNIKHLVYLLFIFVAPSLHFQVAQW